MKNQNNNDTKWRVAKSLWEDYNKRTAAYSQQILKEIYDLQKCFDIEDDMMHAAKIDSMEKIDVDKSRIS